MFSLIIEIDKIRIESTGPVGAEVGTNAERVLAELCSGGVLPQAGGGGGPRSKERAGGGGGPRETEAFGHAE